MKAELSEGDDDPWRRVLERALPANLASISTVGIFSLLDLPVTTANARRVARIMRQSGWIAIRSRKLAPGARRSNECRGWTRTVREQKKDARHG
jgi:hypothetical protein